MSEITFETVQQVVSTAIQQKNVSLFTGAGFTRALYPDSPTWGQLLTRIWDSLNDDIKKVPDQTFDSFKSDGKSFYRIANEMAEALVEQPKGGGPREFIKTLVARQLPNKKNVDPALLEEWRTILTILSPCICVTTNFDLILEALIDRSTTCCLRNPVTHAGGAIPVYHLHGSTDHPQDIVLFEEDSIDTMLPFSYASIKIPSLFYEHVTIMLGYGLGDANVSYFLGLSHFLSDKIKADRKLVLINWSPTADHNTVQERGRLLVVQSRDILQTMKDLLTDPLFGQIKTKVASVEKSLSDYWNTNVQRDQSVIWTNCAEFLKTALLDLDKAFSHPAIPVKHLIPVYARWIDEALSHCGFQFGMSFEGQRVWEAWVGRVMLKNLDLWTMLAEQASARDLQALKTAMTTEIAPG
jgi:hypothetical protein